MQQTKPTTPAAPSLARALDQNETVKGALEHSADELLMINVVLKHEIAPEAKTGEVTQAIEKTNELKDQLQASAEELTQVNQLLEQEIHERADLEHKLTATKAALAQAKGQPA